jgi:ATP phosphoribosyltransferase
MLLRPPNRGVSSDLIRVICCVKYSHVSGSVEAACQLGLADSVLDLCEDERPCPGLENVCTVMTTEAVLISNPHSTKLALIEKLRRRIEGYVTALNYAMLSFDIDRTLLPAAKAISHGFDSPTIMAMENPNMVAVNVLVKVSELSEIMDKLQEVGARGILVMPIANTRL